MILSVHQPQYLPWLGYLDKISKSDVFVFLDSVQYKKREYQNRNKIRTKESSLLLTVPVKTKGRYFQKISDVEIDNEFDWTSSHWKTIQYNYAKAPNFHKYKNIFARFYHRKWRYLFDLNVYVVKTLLKLFDIKTPVYFESDLQLPSASSQRIVDICKAFNADVYLSGKGGKDYIDEELFMKGKIKLVYQEFTPPVYKQNYPGFEPNMSAIDYLFNCGSKLF